MDNNTSKKSRVDLFDNEYYKITTHAIGREGPSRNFERPSMIGLAIGQVLQQIDDSGNDQFVVVHLNPGYHVQGGYMALRGFDKWEVAISQHDVVVLRHVDGLMCTIRFVGGRSSFDVNPCKDRNVVKVDGENK